MSIFPLTLGPAQPDQAEALAALAQASALSSIDDLPEFRDHKDRVAVAMRRLACEQLDTMLVAQNDGRPLGYIVADEATGEITDLFVDPDHQSTGVGAILLAGAEANIRSTGHERSWLSTHANNLRALRFYRTQGYALMSVNEAIGETIPDVTYPKALLIKQLARPDAHDANTMGDVRLGIDTLDPMLLALIAERFTFIDRASELKPSLGMPARVTDRVEEVVTNACNQAQALGFDPELTETLWRTMIDLAIAREERTMTKEGQTIPGESAA